MLNSIEQLIDQSCIKHLSRVVGELQHQLTKKLYKVSDRSKAICRVKCNKARTKGYLRPKIYPNAERWNNWTIYTIRNNHHPKHVRFPVLTKLVTSQIKSIKKLSSCPTCGNQYESLHISVIIKLHNIKTFRIITIKLL